MEGGEKEERGPKVVSGDNWAINGSVGACAWRNETENRMLPFPRPTIVCPLLCGEVPREEEEMGWGS